MKIIQYNSNRSIVVEFQDEHHAQKHTSYQCFIDGSVKNPYHPTKYGIGFIGEGESVRINGKLKKSYTTWMAMMDRCYKSNDNKNPTYQSCYVCDEWHNYRNFEKWFNENIYYIDNETMELDKDILIKNNKKYSPETCCFVPNNINCLFTKSDKIRGEYPIGVTFHNRDKVFEAWCKDGNKKQIYLGRFSNPTDAFYKYKEYKENIIKKIANIYKDKIPVHIYNALINYVVEIND